MAPERWTKDQTWELIKEMRKKSNMKVLFGPEVGEVCLWLHSDLTFLPPHPMHRTRLGTRKTLCINAFQKPSTLKLIKPILQRQRTVSRTVLTGMLFCVVSSPTVSVMSCRLQTKFKEHAQRLRKTGEGVEEYYQITIEGPDHNTDERAVNIWKQIEKDFEYFPDLWKIWSTKPNLVPICATTGVGPQGQKTVLIQSQAPSSERQALGASSDGNQEVGLRRTVSDSQIDPVLLGMSSAALASPETPAMPTEPVADKENATPLSGRRGPRPSALGSSGSSERVTLLPQKRGFEDEMVKMSR
jgi:hypothetical protein